MLFISEKTKIKKKVGIKNKGEDIEKIVLGSMYLVNNQIVAIIFGG